MIARLFAACARGAVARPALSLACSFTLAICGGALALSLRPSAATSTFLPANSQAAAATRALARSFGGEPIEVLVRGNLQQLLLTGDLERMVDLEGCLAGRLPAAALAKLGSARRPCAELARLHAVRVVIGPGTFINEAVVKIDEQLQAIEARARKAASAAAAAVQRQALASGQEPQNAHRLGEEARSITMRSYEAELAALAVRYGITSAPAINNPEFVADLVFAKSAPAGTPKARFSYLFPTAHAALISIRLHAGASEATQARAIALIEGILHARAFALEGASYELTGEPVLVAQLSEEIASAAELLVVAAIVVMALALGLIFAGAPALAPLLVALPGAGITFGALALIAGTLNLGALAVLPALIGLAVDYAVQLQARAQEALERSRQGGDRADASAQRRAAAIEAARSTGPVLGGAALASGASLLALLAAPVPLIHGFALILIGGIVASLVLSLVAGSALFVLGRQPGRALRARAGSAGALLASWWGGARELVREGPLPRLVTRGALAGALEQPRRVLVVGLVLALPGWALVGSGPVQTNIAKLVPASLPGLRALELLERESGVGGQISVLVSGANVATPAAIDWMSSYERAVLARYGGGAQAGGGAAAGSCVHATLCPAFSLPDLFAQEGGGEGAKGGAGAHLLDGREIDALLAAIPPYYSQNVISADHAHATLTFGIHLMPLDKQAQVIAGMRALAHPPRGIRAQVAGLAVVAAASAQALSSDAWRVLILPAALGLAGLVLIILRRGDLRRALLPPAAVAVACGWSALVGALSGVEYNPLSLSLSVLVVAVGCELAVLLSERYRSEREAGRSPAQALALTYSSTGAAVATSGTAVTLGFAVLALSSIRILSDFGLLTLIDLGVTLVGVLLYLPALLVAAERRPALGGAPERARGGSAGARRQRLRRALALLSSARGH
jgi:predicted RND superfamily exporter protein